MSSENSLRQNIKFLLERYEIELKLEEMKSDPDWDAIMYYRNIIDELEYAIKISKFQEWDL